MLDRLALPQSEGGFALTDPRRVADIALVANWCACAAFLAKTVPSLRNIGGSLSASEPVSSSSGPLWGGAVSAFERVRGALVEGRNQEAGRLEEAEARFRAAEARGSGRVPNRVKDAFHRAKARLKVAERSLLLLDPVFDRIPQGGDYLGLQRALSKLAHARARVWRSTPPFMPWPMMRKRLARISSERRPPPSSLLRLREPWPGCTTPHAIGSDPSPPPSFEPPSA